MMTDARRHSGFTLLEILAATAMVAMLVGALYTCLRAAFKARTTATTAVSDVRRADTTMELMRSDLQSAVVPNGVLAGPFVGTSASSLSGSLSDDLTFYTSAMDIEPSEGVGDIKKIEYSCDSSSSSGDLILMRRVTTNLLAVAEPEPKLEVIARGVKSFTLRYYDGQTWLDNWDSTTVENALPLAVQVTVEFTRTAGLGTAKVSRVIMPSCGVDSTATAATAPAGGTQ